jgi:hypothetical protein
MMKRGGDGPMSEKNHSTLLWSAPEHLKLIGLVTANWALVELNLCLLLCFMSNLDWPAARALLLTPTGNRLRTDMLWNFALSQKFSVESMKELKVCLSQVRNCAARRNELMHNYYGMGGAGVVMHKLPAKPSTDEPKLVPLADLQKLADDIADAYAQLQKLPGIFQIELKQRKG